MGLFDFNGDGKISMGENFLSFLMFEECMKEPEGTDDSILYEEATGYEEDDFWGDEDD